MQPINQIQRWASPLVTNPYLKVETNVAPIPGHAQILAYFRLIPANGYHEC